MNMDFAAGMRAAMKLTQQQKLMEATRVIQSALSGLRRPGLQPTKRLEFERLKDPSSISRLRSLSQKRSLSRTTWPTPGGGRQSIRAAAAFEHRGVGARHRPTDERRALTAGFHASVSMH